MRQFLEPEEHDGVIQVTLCLTDFSSPNLLIRNSLKGELSRTDFDVNLEQWLSPCFGPAGPNQNENS